MEAPSCIQDTKDQPTIWGRCKKNLQSVNHSKVAQVALALIFTMGLIAASLFTFGAAAGLVGAGLSACCLKGTLFGVAIGLSASAWVTPSVAHGADSCTQFLFREVLSCAVLTSIAAIFGRIIGIQIGHFVEKIVLNPPFLSNS